VTEVLQAVRVGNDPWLIPVCFRFQWERQGWRMIDAPPGAPDVLARPILVADMPAPEPPPAPAFKPKRKRGRPKGSKTRRGRGIQT